MIVNESPSSQVEKMLLYSSESTRFVIPTSSALRSSLLPSRRAIPRFSSANVVIIVPFMDRTGVSPNAYITSPLSKASMTAA